MKREIRDLLVWLLKHFSNSNSLYEEPSPFPRYTQAQADYTVEDMVYRGTLMPGSKAFAVANTGSEDPLVDEGHFFIAEPLMPKDAINLYIGDWIIADSPIGWRAHHIAAIRVNGEVLEIITRGTNCIRDDPEITRPENLRYLVRGILY